MKQLPKLGGTYKFYDDGKISLSRQYDATVEKIIPFIDSEQIKLHSYIIGDTTLFNIYQHAINNQLEYCKIYSDKTDFFIGCRIPNYDNGSIIWFVRDNSGGWLSLDIEDYWQLGILDSDGEMTKELNKD